MIEDFVPPKGYKFYKAASDILMGTPKMLWFASKKAMVKTIIPKPEVGNGHSLAVGLLSNQHGLKAGVKAEVRSTSAEGLGLDIRFGHPIVFKPITDSWYRLAG